MQFPIAAGGAEGRHMKYGGHVIVAVGIILLISSFLLEGLEAIPRLTYDSMIVFSILLEFVGVMLHVKVRDR